MTQVSELDKLKERIYKISDAVSVQEREKVELATKLESLTRQFENLQETFVNKDLLNVTMGTVTGKIEAMHNQNLLMFSHMETKLVNIKDSIDPLKKSVYYVIAIIVAGFIGGLITLVWKG